MLENPGCKLAAAVSLALLPAGSRQSEFEREGGIRLVYSFDCAAAIEEGRVGADADEQKLIRETLRVVRERLGSPVESVRAEGNTLVVELPDAPALVDELVVGSLAERLEPGERSLTFTATSAEEFPAGAGIVRVGGERMGFERRAGDTLIGLGRTEPRVTHPAGERVVLLGTDRVQHLISTSGELRFLIVAEPADLTALGTDKQRERSHLEAWREAHPDRPLSDFNAVARADGGPVPGIWWFPSARSARTGKPPGPPTMLLPPKGPDDTFTNEDLGRVEQSTGPYGDPTVAFEFKPGRKADFRRFTGPASEGGNMERQMAIVLNGHIETAPVIKSPLPAGGTLGGRYTAEEVEALITMLRSGPLPLALKLERREPVGPPPAADPIPPK